MLDVILKPCTPYKLCAVQNLATLAFGWRLCQAMDPRVSSANFQATMIFCAGTSWLLHTSVISRTMRFNNSYAPGPFSVQALTSTVVAGITLLFEEKTPINIAFAIGSTLIAAASLYNRAYHDEPPVRQ